MSGPKDYSPPPRYSMSVFNGSLNSIFQLQTQIKTQIKKIESLNVNDSIVNINFDCLADLSSLKNNLNNLLKPLVFNYKGKFDQTAYNKISEEISQRITALNIEKNKLDIIENNFFEKQNDYIQYLEYLKYNEHSEISFNDFKQNISDYYKEDIKDVDKAIIKDTIAKISEVTYNKKNDNFSYGFSTVFESKKEEIIDYTKKKEGEINYIRTQASSKILDVSGSISFEKKQEIPSKKVQKWIDNIKVLIENCNESRNKISYRKNLKSLSESKSLKEEYYYKELFDSIYLSEKNRKDKKELLNLISTLNSEDFHLKLVDKKLLLAQRLINLLNNSNIKDSEVSNVKRELNELQLKNQKRIEEDGVLERERLFLKSQVVTTLSNMGYEVMDDLEVIDFEKSNDYLLKVKGQNNYMNLMFREDGSMKYNFQIPENKEDLSVDEKRLKIQEMKMSCDDFNTVISDLRKMGMKLKLNSEQSISESSLMQFTKKTKERLKEKQSKSAKNQEQVEMKKRYLD